MKEVELQEATVVCEAAATSCRGEGGVVVCEHGVPQRTYRLMSTMPQLLEITK